MLTDGGWRPGTIDTTIPAPPTEADLVLPKGADFFETAIDAPLADVTITPPLRIVGWDEELLAWHVLEQLDFIDPITAQPAPFVVGPNDPPLKIKLSGSPSVRRLHLQAAGLSGALTMRQRGISERSDT